MRCVGVSHRRPSLHLNFASNIREGARSVVIKDRDNNVPISETIVVNVDTGGWEQIKALSTCLAEST